MHVLSQRIPLGICMNTEKNRSDVSNTSAKQPWRSNPEGAKKKKPEDPNSKKDNSSHALIAINSFTDAWIVDS
jgi:ankyrin repeat protein